MLTAIYHMLKNGTEHEDLGADHFDRRSTEIKRLGFEVEICPLPPSRMTRNRPKRHDMKLPQTA
jgi:hypothetical protein